MKQKILVTGGTGFIGSHTTVELQEAGYEVVIIDNLSNSNIQVLDGIEKITGIRPAFEQVDCCDMPALEGVFQKYPGIQGIIHFAASKAVGESVEKPLLYYRNNLTSLINLLELMPKYGVKGIISFEKTIKYLKANYPHHFIIADAKRGDIGNTSAMYARTFFDEYDVDSLTVAPYMGEDSVMPFLGYEGKWVILLALTSNKGSHDFQLTEDSNGERLFEKVLKTSQHWGNEENMMYVVGATQGKMFEDIRRIVPNHFLLVPGVGAQGGSLQEVCKYGMTKDCGLLVNSSRGIIYASSGEDFAEVASAKAKELQKEMEKELTSM